MNLKIIFSLAIARKLIDRGFILKDKRPDYTNPVRWVYFFEDTPELRKAFYEIQEDWKTSNCS